MSLALIKQNDMREKVERLEAEMLARPQLNIPMQHHFAAGLYARQMDAPANALLTGRIHKREQINILAAGVMEVWTGERVELVQAPFVIVSPPGTKRIALTHTPCTWITILPTDLKDPDLIEAEFTVATNREYLDFQRTLALEGVAECPS